MHETLRKSPLTYVLAEIKFSEILSMSDHIVELQKTIRDAYSEFRQQTIKTIDMDKSESKTVDIWHFLDKTFTSGVMLSTNSVVIHTSNYVSFDDLLQRTKNILAAFNPILKNKLYLRIGLRYVNLINSSIHKCLEPGLLGNPLKNKEVFEEVYLAKSETIQKTKCGTIKVMSMHCSDKNIVGQGALYVPPNLCQGAGFISFEHHKNKAPKKEYVMLDIDHFTDVRGDFLTNRIAEQLEALHEGAFIAFSSVVKKEALIRWQ